MKTKIGAFDPRTGQIAVEFRHGGVTHPRHINAVLDDTGALDLKATKARVQEVARGVQRKIELGVLH
jgi:hypothetical protein